MENLFNKFDFIDEVSTPGKVFIAGLIIWSIVFVIGAHYIDNSQIIRLLCYIFAYAHFFIFSTILVFQIRNESDSRSDKILIMLNTINVYAWLFLIYCKHFHPEILQALL